MVVPFSNSKLRVPVGFQSLLVGLSTEVLRSQPRNIHEFAANYFENLLRRREQGHNHASNQQRSLEDRYYNNRSFQEDYSVNRPDLNDAATKIQAQYRGHQTRESLRQMKDDNKQMIDDGEHHGVEGERETHHGSSRISPDDHDQRASPRERNPAEVMSPDVHHHHHQKQFGQEPFEEELEPSTTHNQFDHFQAARVGAATLERDEQDESDAEEEHWTRAQQQHSANRMDSDRRAQIDLGDQDEVDHADQSQRSSRSTEHFDKHPEQSHPQSFRDDDQEMNDNTDRTKAATRIQASYRGYKIRKELGSTSGHSYSTHEHHPSSVSPRHGDDDYDSARSKNILSPSAEENKVPANEHNDNAAAVKIQAAYRGYRVRKDLEK